MISLVWNLGWVFETQERKNDRPLVIRTIPISQTTPNIQIHPLHNNIHVSKVHCGSAFEPGVSRLPYYCTSICVRSWCNWRAKLGIPNQKKKKASKSKKERRKNNLDGWLHYILQAWVFRVREEDGEEVNRGS